MISSNEILSTLSKQICANVVAKHAQKKSPLAKPKYKPVTPNEIHELQAMGFIVSVKGVELPVQSKLL